MQHSIFSKLYMHAQTELPFSEQWTGYYWYGLLYCTSPWFLSLLDHSHTCTHVSASFFFIIEIIIFRLHSTPLFHYQNEACYRIILWVFLQTWAHQRNLCLKPPGYSAEASLSPTHQSSHQCQLASQLMRHFLVKHCSLAHLKYIKI